MENYQEPTADSTPPRLHEKKRKTIPRNKTGNNKKREIIMGRKSVAVSPSEGNRRIWTIESPILKIYPSREGSLTTFPPLLSNYFL